MDNIKEFFETSTIHGLHYIATTQKAVRLLWVIIVVAGFTVAGTLIYQSFNAWKESPIATTIESRPISKITFPSVTVCPPKNTFTDLNYDLMMTQKMTLNNETREELATYAMELLYDDIFDAFMTNMTLIEDNDRYLNWYFGYTNIMPSNGKYGQIMNPSYDTISEKEYLVYRVETSALSGTISTKHFGEKFDADKVERDIWYQIYVKMPESVEENENVTFHLQVDKMSMKDLSSGEDNTFLASLHKNLDDVVSHASKNFTPPYFEDAYKYKYLHLRRKVTLEDVKKQKLDTMPGFRFSWHYSGMEVKPEAIYSKNQDITKLFVR